MESGKTAVEPKSPTKEGYTFAEWYNGVSIFDFATPITADITLTAYWTKNAVTPTNPEIPAGSDSNANENSGNSNENSSGKPNDSENNGGSNTTENPPATIYTVSFNLNDGSDSPAIKTQSVTENIATALSTVTTLGFARTGYVFAGWNTAQDGSETAYADGAEITANGNITLYAQWTAGTATRYTVQHYQQNIEDDNYTLVEADTQILTGATGGMTSASARSYSGFFALEFSQTKIAADGSTVVKIYYKRLIISVVFKASGGTWSDGTTENKFVSGKFGAPVVPPEFPILAKHMAEWTPPVQETFTGGAIYSVKWTAVGHTAYLHCNDGSGKIVEQDLWKSMGETTALDTADSLFGKDDMYFVKWTTNKDGTGTEYDDKAEVSTDEDITLYAQWEGPIIYIYNANDGSENPETKKIVYTKRKIDLKTAYDVGFSRQGYVVGGWLENPLTYEQYLQTSSDTLDAWLYGQHGTVSYSGTKRQMVTLYALWVPEGTTAKYEVRHLRQKDDGKYEVIDRESFTGKVGDYTTAQTKNYGAKYIMPEVTQIVIDVPNRGWTYVVDEYPNSVDIFYNIKTVTLTFEVGNRKGSGGWFVKWSDGTTKTKTVSANYGTDISTVEIPQLAKIGTYSYTGYAYNGYNEQPECTEDKTYIADYIVPYVIYHVRHEQKDDGSLEDNRITEKENFWGWAGDNWVITPKEYDGFFTTDDSPDRELKPLLTFETYYTYNYYPKEMKVILCPEGGTWTEDNSTADKTVIGKYKEESDFPEITREGYTLKEWQLYDYYTGTKKLYATPVKEKISFTFEQEYHAIWEKNEN